MGILGALVGGVGGVIGNLMGQNAAKDAAKKAWKRQKTVLQNEVQWRVADAIKAGIHPLAALGMNPASGPAIGEVGADWGSTLGNMGQDLGNSIEAKMSPHAKVEGQLERLSLERASLENESLRTQIASQRMRLVQQSAPGVPGDTTKNSSFTDPTTGKLISTRNVGDQAEGAFGDGVGDLYGWANWFNSVVAPKFGIPVQSFWDDPIGTATGVMRRASERYLDENAGVKFEYKRYR